MAITLYDVSVPLLKQLFGSMCDVLDKGAAFAAAKKVDPSVLLQSRLAPDMFPLMRQVQVATDMSKGGIARIGGVEVPAFPDEEKTFDDAKARIARTIAFIDSVPADAINAWADKEIVLTLGREPNRRELKFPTGTAYMMHWVIPNFTFHCATAYDILRHNGVEIGKADFLGKM